jgi:hypothetical protein
LFLKKFLLESTFIEYSLDTMEVRGSFSVTNEDLLTYLPSNWSQWSRWFLDQSQIYYGELAVVLRKKEWPTTAREDEMRI